MSNNFVLVGSLSGDAVLDGVAQKVFFESVKIGTGSPSAAPSPASKVWLYADRSQNPAIMWLWDPSTATWHITSDGTGTGAVDSVNGQTGIVVLDHTDVGAEEAGAVADLAATLATVATSGDYDDLVNKPTIPDTSNLVEDTDPRLSDARTPLAHTHPATAVSTVPATTGLDPASTDVEKALTELAARPSGGGTFRYRALQSRYLNPNVSVSTVNQALTGRVAYVAVDVTTEQAWDAIAIHVATAETDATLELGLVADDPLLPGYPGGLIESVTVGLGSVGPAVGVFASPHMLQPGTYWLASVLSAPANTVRIAVSSNTAAVGTVPYTYSKSVPPGATDAFGSAGYLYTGASIPASAPAGMTMNRYLPLPGLRAAAW